VGVASFEIPGIVVSGKTEREKPEREIMANGNVTITISTGEAALIANLLEGRRVLVEKKMNTPDEFYSDWSREHASITDITDLLRHGIDTA